MIKREKVARGETDEPAEGSVTDIRTLPKATVAKKPVTVEERDYDPAKHKVRTVGPVFLPSSESAIDLGRPADAGVN